MKAAEELCLGEVEEQMVLLFPGPNEHHQVQRQYQYLPEFFSTLECLQQTSLPIEGPLQYLPMSLSPRHCYSGLDFRQELAAQGHRGL